MGRSDAVVSLGLVNDSPLLRLPVVDGGAHDWQKEMDGVKLTLGESEGQFVVQVQQLVQVARGCDWHRASGPTKLLDLGEITFAAMWEVPGERRTVTREVHTCTVGHAREVLAAARDAKVNALKNSVASDAVLDAIVAALVAMGRDVIASKQEEFRTAQEQFPIRIRRLQESLERPLSPEDAPLSETREPVMRMVPWL
jgi:hypothetical protein